MANNKKADDHHVFGLSAWVVDCRRGGAASQQTSAGKGLCKRSGTPERCSVSRQMM